MTHDPTQVSPPTVPPMSYGGARPGTLPKRRNVLAVWIGLPLITLGIYSLVWYYKINSETRFNPSTRVNPLGSLLAITFGSVLVVPPFVSVYRTGQRIAAAQAAAGMSATCSGGLGLLLIFVFGTYPLYYQAEMNKIAAR
jgi:Domain of unknown function (DUF4234)